MPFATYYIKENSLDNLSTEHKKNYEKFIWDLEKLNRKNRAILVNEKYDILKKKIKAKIDSLDKPIKITRFEREQAKKIGKDINTEIATYHSNNNLLEREFLHTCLICFNSSYKSNSLVEKKSIDFEKNSENKLDDEIFDRFDRDVISSADFENLYDFKEKYLNKLEIFIKSISNEEIETESKKKKIDSITIFHKELSKYLMPNFSRNSKIKKYQIDEFLNNSITNNQKNISSNILLHEKAKEKSKEFNYWKDKKENIKKLMDDNLNKKEDANIDPKEIIQIIDTYYEEGLKKIEAGAKFLLEWWHNLPNDIKPKKFNIITDIPPQLKYAHYNEQNTFLLRIKEFLTKNYKNNLFKPDVFFLNSKEIENKDGQIGKFWKWKHKKHFVFSNKIVSDLGGSNNDENNISLLIGSEYGVEFADPNFDNYEKEKGNIKMNPDNNDFIILKNDNHHYKQIKTLFNVFPKKCGL